MRSLQRNMRKLYYAIPVGEKAILDDYGNDTLEVEIEYSDPVELYANVSANVGQEAVNVFGSLTGYNRTVTYSGMSCPLVEGCIVWFNTDVTGPHNYVVIKVADSVNGYVIALREVSNSGQTYSNYSG